MEVTLCEELVEGLAELICGGDRVAVVDCFFSSLEEFACGGGRISEVAEFFSFFLPFPNVVCTLLIVLLREFHHLLLRLV